MNSNAKLYILTCIIALSLCTIVRLLVDSWITVRARILITFGSIFISPTLACLLATALFPEEKPKKNPNDQVRDKVERQALQLIGVGNRAHATR
jgi:hypothetical protein